LLLVVVSLGVMGETFVASWQKLTGVQVEEACSLAEQSAGQAWHWSRVFVLICLSEWWHASLEVDGVLRDCCKLRAPRMPVPWLPEQAIMALQYRVWVCGCTTAEGAWDIGAARVQFDVGWVPPSP
jgi:hypothetical protein